MTSRRDQHQQHPRACSCQRCALVRWQRHEAPHQPRRRLNRNSATSVMSGELNRENTVIQGIPAPEVMVARSNTTSSSLSSSSPSTTSSPSGRVTESLPGQGTPDDMVAWHRRPIVNAAPLPSLMVLLSPRASWTFPYHDSLGQTSDEERHRSSIREHLEEAMAIVEELDACLSTVIAHPAE